MIMRSWSASGSASSGPRGTRAPSCCACARCTPSSRWRSPPATPRRASCAASRTRAWRRPIPTSSSSSTSPSACEGLDLVFLGLPHGAAQGDRPRAAQEGRRVVDLSADFRLKDADAVPAVVRRARTSAPSSSPSSPTGCPSCTATRSSGRPLVATPGCYPTAATLALAPLVARRRRRAERASSSTPPAACRAPVGRRRRTPRSARSTRTSPPTGCSTTATRPRSSR